MRKRLMVALWGALGLAALCFGQATDTILVGTITDSTGAAVPKASVTATNQGTGVKYTGTSNEMGEYRINNIPVGTYNVSATAQGFAAGTMGGVELLLNHTATVNMTLTVGAVSTAVEVAAAAATIDTSTSQLQSTYDTRTAVDIPMAGAASSKIIGTSGIWNLSLVGAGVASSG